MEKLNISLDASTASWLTDLEIDDYNLFPEYDMSLFNVDDIEFLSHDIASSLHPLHSDEMSLERPTKQLKTNSWNSSNITEHFSPDLSSSSSPTTTTSHNLYFENSNSSHVNTLNPKQNDLVSVSQPQERNTNLMAQTRKGTSENQSKGTKRSSSHGHNHIIAERKRREKLSQSLIALAALIPGLKKMDKASVLGDAIKYMKDLKERLRLLEEESKKRVVESVVIVNKPQVSGDDDSSSCDESEALPHVDARVSDKEVLLRIHCHKQKGILVKILDHIQKLHLFVVNSTVLPFGKNSIIDITIVAKMGTGYNLTLKDLLTKLRVATLKSMS
ncbi:hypothetical protein TanjilG_27832 [Lupinus angustifolius]|uniref:BHLH domain-containing protein n=1 Tax=Lupinus angustifolius TaxID=3871 RepID=A0A4P1RHU9_LUPAN|nr:PREDICTED: transcription factor bHLH25-like [Lupinus angustifolius]OIW10886.1 hypothetical protein TanjilG_27832 [Lupinus angustifolius]